MQRLALPNLRSIVGGHFSRGGEVDPPFLLPPEAEGLAIRTIFRRLLFQTKGLSTNIQLHTYRGKLASDQVPFAVSKAPAG